MIFIRLILILQWVDVIQQVDYAMELKKRIMRLHNPKVIYSLVTVFGGFVIGQIGALLGSYYYCYFWMETAETIFFLVCITLHI
jgi:hypothetical protein